MGKKHNLGSIIASSFLMDQGSAGHLVRPVCDKKLASFPKQRAWEGGEKPFHKSPQAPTCLFFSQFFNIATKVRSLFSTAKLKPSDLPIPNLDPLE
jgi:hypothetical protein